MTYRIFPRIPFRILNRATSRFISSVSDPLLTGESPNAGRLTTGLELEFLGTSSATSTLTRNVSCIALNFGGGTLLFDCGEGTVRQFIKSTVRPSQIQAVFITHLHGDHIYGLLGLGMKTIELRGSNKHIKLVAPKGLKSLFGRAITHHRQFKVHEIYPHGKEPVSEDGTPTIPWDTRERAFLCFDHPQFTVKAAPIKHSIYCMGYVIQEKESRGSMLAGKLKLDFGLEPGPIFSEIAANPTVVLPDGRIIISSEYMTKPRKGRKIVILGDTCDPRGIAELAMDADVLVHEATCSDSEKTVALEHFHSTAGMAGSFARAIRAKHLILTHFSPRNFNSSECTL